MIATVISKMPIVIASTAPSTSGSNRPRFHMRFIVKVAKLPIKIILDFEYSPQKIRSSDSNPDKKK